MNKFYDLSADITYAISDTTNDQEDRRNDYKLILKNLNEDHEKNLLTKDKLYAYENQFKKSKLKIYNEITHEEAFIIANYIDYFYQREKLLKDIGCDDLLDNNDNDNNNLKIGAPIGQAVSLVLNLIKNVAAKSPKLLSTIPSLLKRLNLTRILPIIQKQLKSITNLGNVAKSLKAVSNTGGKVLGKFGSAVKSIPLDKIIDASTKAAKLAGNVSTVADAVGKTSNVITTTATNTQRIQLQELQKQQQQQTIKVEQLKRQQQELELQRKQFELERLIREAEREKALQQSIPLQTIPTTLDTNFINSISLKISSDIDDLLEYGKMMVRAHHIINYYNYHEHIKSLKKNDIKDSEIFKSMNNHLIGQNLNDIVATAVKDESAKRIYNTLVPKEIKELEPSIQLKVLPVLARFIPLLRNALPSIQRVIPIVFKESFNNGETELQKSQNRLCLLKLLKSDPSLQKSALNQLLMNESSGIGSKETLLNTVPKIVYYIQDNKRYLDFSKLSTEGLFNHIDLIESSINKMLSNEESEEDHELLNDTLTNKKSILLIAQQRIKNNISLPNRIDFTKFIGKELSEIEILENQLKNCKCKRDELKIKLKIKKLNK